MADKKEDKFFGLQIPSEIDGVPSNILDPRNVWEDKDKYDATAIKLAGMFHENFKKFGTVAEGIMKNGAPRV